MKKFVIILLTAVILASVLCISVSASPVSDIIDHAHTLDSKNKVPDAIYKMAQNTLKQVPVSADQATQVNAVLDEIKAAVPEYKGVGAEYYTANEVKAVMDGLKKICDILKITMTIENIEGGENIAVHLTYNGKEIAVIDFDSIKTTGTSYENEALAIASVVTVIGAAAILVTGLKKKVYEN